MSGPFVDPELAANRGVLAYLAAENERGLALSLAPDEVADPYLPLGAHPDVVQRVWKDIAPSPAWRAVVLGRPAAVDPGEGAVVAPALGTSYWLRVAPEHLGAALSSGARQRHTYGRNGPVLDAAASFGPTWIHGLWDAREPEWLGGAAHARS